MTDTNRAEAPSERDALAMKMGRKHLHGCDDLTDQACWAILSPLARDNALGLADVAIDFLARRAPMEAESMTMTVIDPAQWSPCSPAWLQQHPDQCGVAPRVWNEGDANHYHPKDWPNAAPPVANPAPVATVNGLVDALADERDYTIALRSLIVRAREYVNDAVDAHRHDDGVTLLSEIGAILAAKEVVPPLSTYPEDHAGLLMLARKVLKDADEKDVDRLADWVRAILEDEAARPPLAAAPEPPAPAPVAVEGLTQALRKLAERHPLPWVCDWQPDCDPPEAGGTNRIDATALSYEPCGYDDGDGRQIDTLSVEFAEVIDALNRFALASLQQGEGKLTPLSRMVLASICEVNDRKPNLWALIDPGLYGTTRQLDADGFIISGLAGYHITPAGRAALASDKEG